VKEVEFDDKEQVCFVTLGLGPRVEVLAPVALRERVRKDPEAAYRMRPTPPLNKKGSAAKNQGAACFRFLAKNSSVRFHARSAEAFSNRGVVSLLKPCCVPGYTNAS